MSAAHPDAPALASSPGGRRPPDARPPAVPLLDLRLAGFAVAAWLSALTALHLTAQPSVTLGVVATVLAALAATLGGRHRVFGGLDAAAVAAPAGRRARPRRLTALIRAMAPVSAGIAHARWLAVAVLLGAACGAVSTATRVAVRDAAPLAALVREGATVRAELVVRDDPRGLRGTPGLPPTYLLAVDLTAVHPDEPAPTIRLSARALVLASNPAWRTLLPGQRIAATGRLSASRGGDLRAAVLAVKEAPVLRGRTPWAQRAAGTLRAGLQRACEPLPDDVGGLLPGLVVGDTSRLDPAVEADFRTTGMTHLNAVSGANVAIVLGVVLFAVRWARAGPVITALICGVALIGFVILARPSPSVVRAAAMGAIGLLALAAGRPRGALPALATAVVVLTVVDPELAGDAGFALSVLATAGLLVLAPRWRDAMRRRGVPAGLAEAVAVPAAAQLACGPVVAGLSGAVSLVSVPANLLAVPAIAPATLLGVLAAVLSPIWPAGAEFAAWLGSWPARWLVTVATYGARIPAGAVPWPDGVTGAALLSAVTIALLVAARRPLVRRLVAVVSAGAVLGALPVRLLASGWPPPGWVAVTCAVGQGDAIVLPAGPGRAVVVDAGPDPIAVDQCLRRLGVRRVVLFAVSHFHIDHVGGVAGVFRGRTVAGVVTPAWPQPTGGRAAVLAQAAAGRSPVHAVAAGWSYAVAGLELTVLGPAEGLHGTRSDANNNSLVVRAVVDGRTMLLTGDAESEQQQALLERLGPQALRADVLKVSHHGSAYQEPAFLDAVDPAVALVSVGTGNTYGHPNPALLSRLGRDGARVLRTDLNGDLAAVRSGDGLAVVARGIPPDR